MSSSSTIPAPKYSVDDFFVLKKLCNAQHTKTILSTFSGSVGITCLNTPNLQVKMQKTHFPQFSLLLKVGNEKSSCFGPNFGMGMVSSNKILMEMLHPQQWQMAHVYFSAVKVFLVGYEKYSTPEFEIKLNLRKLNHHLLYHCNHNLCIWIYNLHRPRQVNQCCKTVYNCNNLTRFSEDIEWQCVFHP